MQLSFSPHAGRRACSGLDPGWREATDEGLTHAVAPNRFCIPHDAARKSHRQPAVS
jgi:hypothetical protein